MPPNEGPAAANEMPPGRCCCGFVDFPAALAISVTTLPSGHEPQTYQRKMTDPFYVGIA
jgi:hypothetical protein